MERGDRIGVLLPNGVRWTAALLGAHAAGLCAVPLNTWFRPKELIGVTRRAGLRAIIADADIAEDNRAAMDFMVGVGRYVGTFRWTRGDAAPVGLPPAGEPAGAEPISVDESDHALLLFTSGSSAEPKAVPLTHGAVVRNAHAVGVRQGVIPGDRFWLASPMFFVFGCANALPNALTHAATLCVQERFDPLLALNFIERNRCTVYYAVAPITRALAACPDLKNHDISSLRTGTANATPEDLRLAIEVLGVSEVCNAYGLTEGLGHTTITSHLDPPQVRITTQGRALPTQQLRIVGVDGSPVRDGQAGEIQIRGAIMEGYLDATDAHATAFDQDGWFRTRDIGVIDEDGRLHYLGRSSEMMKVKGINVSPAEVELALVEHHLVDEAYVFGLPTPDGDEAVGCALVTTSRGAQRAGLAADVASWARDQMSSYKIPARIWVMDSADLPLTPTGKVSKRLLKDQLSKDRL